MPFRFQSRSDAVGSRSGDSSWVRSAPWQRIQTATFPVSVRLALAAAFLPNASSVAGSLTPDTVGAYSIVTMHDFLGPKLVPVQPSDVTVNVAGPDNETVNAADAEPPVFVSVNVRDWTSPTPTVPKSKLPLVAGDQLIDGGLPAFPTAAETNSVDATATATMTIRTKTRIIRPLRQTAAMTAAETPIILASSTAVKARRRAQPTSRSPALGARTARLAAGTGRTRAEPRADAGLPSLRAAGASRAIQDSAVFDPEPPTSCSRGAAQRGSSALTSHAFVRSAAGSLPVARATPATSQEYAEAGGSRAVVGLDPPVGRRFGLGWRGCGR